MGITLCINLIGNTQYIVEKSIYQRIDNGFHIRILYIHKAAFSNIRRRITPIHL